VIRRLALAMLVLGVVAAMLPASAVGVGGSLVLAARVTLVVGVAGSLLGAVVGVLAVATGLALGGRGRLVVTRVAESVSALPTVLLVPLFAAAPLGPPLVRLVLALALARAGEAMHLSLLEARSLSSERWVEASLALGASRGHLVRAHLVPRLFPVLGATVLSGAAMAIVLDVSVAFLGLAPSTGLGATLATELHAGRPLAMIPPALVATSLAASLAILGFHLRRRAEPLSMRSDMPVSIVDEQTFRPEVMQSELPVLVEFFADWCAPCKQIAPEIEALSRDLEGKAKVVKVNIDKSPMLAQSLRIQSVPTFMVFAKGRPVDAQVGALRKPQLRAMIEPFLPRPEGAILPAELAQLVSQRQVVPVDIREAAVFARAHLPTAVSMPEAEIPTRLAELQMLVGEPVLYCRGGDKAKALAEKLAGSGIAVAFLDGGLLGWEAEGLPLDRPD
jgi:thioredoxin 1/putative thioredoxin